MRSEKVPGPKWRPPADLPHVLVVSGDEDDKEWEVEHPDECARACPWWPEAVAQIADLHPLADGWIGFDTKSGIHLCLVEHEIENNSLDSLFGEFDGASIEGLGDGWKALPAGRYLIAGWYTPGGWAGANPIDPDGGLELLGRETP
jgi:hypothetical protein